MYIDVSIHLCTDFQGDPERVWTQEAQAVNVSVEVDAQILGTFICDVRILGARPHAQIPIDTCMLLNSRRAAWLH